MPTSTFVHPLFGAVTFRTANTTQWVRGDRISFVSGFDQGDIVPLRIPQLAAVPGTDGATLPFHRRGHAQLLKAFADIEAAGLMPHIRTCAGTLNLRLRRPTSGGLSKLPSNHAFGIAIDLNSDDGSLGSSVAPVAPHFIANGFTWGADFADPMHFEVRRFSEPLDVPMATGDSTFTACLQRVHNRGQPPVAFLEELVAWGRTAPLEIFQRNSAADIYTSVVGVLGPWQNDLHRRAAMLEVLRVLGGFESAWDWQAGRDVTHPSSTTPCTEKVGLFQCSANSMALAPGLKALLVAAGGDGSCDSFIAQTQANHAFALEYCARLLRVTTKHHGTVRDGLIHPWLRRDAMGELMRCLELG